MKLGRYRMSQTLQCSQKESLKPRKRLLLCLRIIWKKLKSPFSFQTQPQQWGSNRVPVLLCDLIMWMNSTLTMEQERMKIHLNVSIKLRWRILPYSSVLNHSKLMWIRKIAFRGT